MVGLGAGLGHGLPVGRGGSKGSRKSSLTNSSVRAGREARTAGALERFIVPVLEAW